MTRISDSSMRIPFRVRTAILIGFPVFWQAPFSLACQPLAPAASLAWLQRGETNIFIADWAEQRQNRQQKSVDTAPPGFTFAGNNAPAMETPMTRKLTVCGALVLSLTLIFRLAAAFVLRGQEEKTSALKTRRVSLPPPARC